MKHLLFCLLIAPTLTDANAPKKNLAKNWELLNKEMEYIRKNDMISGSPLKVKSDIIKVKSSAPSRSPAIGPDTSNFKTFKRIRKRSR